MPFLSMAARPLTEEAGRLGTRAGPGRPAKRWEQGVSDARAYVEYERIAGLLRVTAKAKAKQKYLVKEVVSLTPGQLQQFDDVGDYVA